MGRLSLPGTVYSLGPGRRISDVFRTFGGRTCVTLGRKSSPLQIAEAIIDERGGYLAYLVRLWHVHSSGKSEWRAAIESPHTGERHAFADLAGLITYLEQQTSSLDLLLMPAEETGDDPGLGTPAAAPDASGRELEPPLPSNHR
jgi:hypothetical protein